MWLDDFFQSDVKNEYFRVYRKKNRARYHKTQLKHYYKYHERILAGYRKPQSGDPDEYDQWSWGKE